MRTSLKITFITILLAGQANASQADLYWEVAKRSGEAAKAAATFFGFAVNKAVKNNNDIVTEKTPLQILQDDHTSKMSAWSCAMTTRDDAQKNLDNESDPQKKELLAAKLAQLEIEVQETSKQEIAAETAVKTFVENSTKSN
jgi:hypothetical protein